MERPQNLPHATPPGGLLQALVEAYAALGRWLWRGSVAGPRRPGTHANRAV